MRPGVEYGPFAGQTYEDGPERECEVVAIEPTDKDGQPIFIWGAVGTAIFHGRLVLRPVE